MGNLVIREVDFQGATLMAVQTEDGKIHVGVKWICQGLGLTEGQTKAERNRVQQDLVLSKLGRKIVLATRYGEKETLVIDIKGLPLWLAKINSNIINDARVREKLVDYQLNAADVLAKAFIEEKRGAKDKSSKQGKECLGSVNNAAKILLPILKQAGCPPKIQLLTIKSLYEKSGVMLPIEIEAGKKYHDTKHIARQCGMYTKSGKPAYQAAGEIAKKLELREDQYTDTWEAKGNWEGAVRKYDDSVIAAIKEWLEKNGNPEHIEYQQSDGQIKKYHVFYKLLGEEVA